LRPSRLWWHSSLTDIGFARQSALFNEIRAPCSTKSARAVHDAVLPHCTRLHSEALPIPARCAVWLNQRRWPVM
jgi:hypothetical protein